MGDRLRALRGDLSLRDVEREIGIARADISRYEKGVIAPTPQRLQKLAAYYELPYKELRMLYFDDLYAGTDDLKILIEWANRHEEADTR